LIEGERLAQYTAPQKQGLGPGFWPVTIAMAVVSVAMGVWIWTLNIDAYLPEAASPAGDIDALFKFMSVVANTIFVYVAGYVVYFSIVWRRRANDPRDAIGIQIHDAPKLEFWWTVIPAILVAILAIASIRVWYTLQNANGDQLTMESIGHQFKYEFRYPKLKDSVYDDMHVPVDTQIALHVTSADVIHSFWVPEARVKYDMVPGLVQTIRFTPHKVGTFRVICTEFCGTNHGNMVATLHVDTMHDFQRWLGEQATKQTASASPVVLAGGSVSAGQALFSQKCTACHSIGAFSQKIVGPGLGHLANDPDHPMLVNGEKPDAAGISHILINGYQGADDSQGKNGPSLGAMPNRQANALSNADIANLVAYLLSLSSKKS
jgi:cytochrome c oxidase subunit 2